MKNQITSNIKYIIEFLAKTLHMVVFQGFQAMTFGTQSRLEVDILIKILEFITPWFESNKSVFTSETDGKREVI